MENIGKTEYLHKLSKKVYSHQLEFAEDSEEHYCFQQSENPTLIGYKYERDFIEAEAEKPETV